MGSGRALGPVQVRRADLALAEQLDPLGQQLLELRDAPALAQHVPVRTGRLLLLRLRLLAGGPGSLAAAVGALPDRGHLGVVRHGDLDHVAAGAVVRDHLAGSELNTTVILEADPTQPRTTQYAIRHVKPPRSSSVPTVGRPGSFPFWHVRAICTHLTAPDNSVVTRRHRLFTEHGVSRPTDVRRSKSISGSQPVARKRGSPPQ